MNSPSPLPLSPHARRQASEWLLLLRERETDLEVRTSFLAWIRKSPENVHAFLRILATWEATGLLQGSALFDLNSLVAQARANSNVVELNPQTSDSISEDLNHKRRRVPMEIAVAATIVLTLGSALIWYMTHKDIYSTSLGEQRTVALQDGSTIVLNSKSRVRVRLTDHLRDIDLLDGQALFRVAHDTARPFVVHTELTNVRAVGTEFDVYRKQTSTVVTVVEGAVAIEPQHPSSDSRQRSIAVNSGPGITSGSASDQKSPDLKSSALLNGSARGLRPESPHGQLASNGSGTANTKLRQLSSTTTHGATPSIDSGESTPSSAASALSSAGLDAVLLSAGEQLTVSGTSIPTPEPADIAVAIAWTQGKLIFKDAPLSDVVSEFNRCSTRRLIIDSPALEEFHVTGKFPANDPQRLVELLKQRFNVRVHDEGTEIHILRP